MLTTKMMNTQLTIHKDWISLIMRWNYTAVPTIWKVRSVYQNEELEVENKVKIEPRITLSECISSQDIWIDC